LKVGPLLANTGQPVDTPQELAEEFNEYFSSVFTKEDTANVPTAKPIFTGSEAETLTTLDINDDMIRKKLSLLRSDKSPGNDALSSRLLREIQEELVHPLRILFTKSLRNGLIPEDWRTANVTPIFKKGSRNQVDNYRPVSLTSQVSKIMESLIRDAIVSHLEQFKLLCASQHGFRSGNSCLSNLLTFLDEVTRSVEEGHSVDVIYLDFAKAFDKVPHQRLLEKLHSHGIRGDLQNWIAAWLGNRKQRVCVRGCASG